MNSDRYHHIGRAHPVALTLAEVAALANWSEQFVLSLEAKGAFKATVLRDGTRIYGTHDVYNFIWGGEV